jgi:hypothetical protein
MDFEPPNWDNQDGSSGQRLGGSSSGGGARHHAEPVRQRLLFGDHGEELRYHYRAQGGRPERKACGGRPYRGLRGARDGTRHYYTRPHRRHAYRWADGGGWPADGQHGSYAGYHWMRRGHYNDCHCLPDDDYFYANDDYYGGRHWHD